MRIPHMYTYIVDIITYVILSAMTILHLNTACNIQTIYEFDNAGYINEIRR
jgi:hypothetical protein